MKITPIKQVDEDSCYSPMLKKEMGKIDWQLEAKTIVDKIRGLNPVIISFTQYKDETLKVHVAKVLDEKSTAKCGTVLTVSKEGIKVAAKDKVVLLQKVQLPGGKPLMVEEFIKGNSIEINSVLC